MKSKKTKAAPKMRHETDCSGYVLGATVGTGKLPRGTKAARVPLKKINAVAALRREFAEVKARELSERLEKETAQRLLRERDAEVATLREARAGDKEWLDHLERKIHLQDRELCAATGADIPIYARSARMAMRWALGAKAMALGELEVAREDLQRAQDQAAAARERLDWLRTAVRTWAESYFAADDPERAWVLSMLDPVVEKPAAVNLESRSGTYVAAEGKSA